MTRYCRFPRPVFALTAGVLVSAALAMSGIPAVHAQALPVVSADTSALAQAPPGAASATPVKAAPPGTPGTAVYNERPMVGMKLVRLTGRAESIVRFGPGNTFAIVGTYPKGTSFPVIAKSGAWYGVRVSETETGWIHASLCKEMDDLSGLEFRPNPKLYSRTGSYVLSGYGGAYAYDRKSNSAVLGGRLGYYVFDRVQVEGGLAWTHVNRPAEIVESLFDLSLEAERYHMLFYHLIATYELLPGRQMVPYLSGGVGSAIMRGESEPTINYGAGTTLYMSKRTAMRWEVRDYRFSSGTGSARRKNNNIEFTLGSLLLF